MRKTAMDRGRILAVSDIHGHGRLLELLLARAGYESGRDRLFLLGDYVNKGPDSAGTLKLVSGLVGNGAVAIQGNNERKWLDRRFRQGRDDNAKAAARYRSFLEGLPLWAAFGRYLFVHAGLRPGVPLSEQSAADMTEIREPFLSSRAWDGVTVVFGHTSTFRLGAVPGRVWFGDGKLGIDTGAGHGCVLSLIDLTGGRQWSVPVRGPGAVRNEPLFFGWPE